MSYKGRNYEKLLASQSAKVPRNTTKSKYPAFVIRKKKRLRAADAADGRRDSELPWARRCEFFRLISSNEQRATNSEPTTSAHCYSGSIEWPTYFPIEFLCFPMRYHCVVRYYTHGDQKLSRHFVIQTQGATPLCCFGTRAIYLRGVLGRGRNSSATPPASRLPPPLL
jgi:hypothetical protein